MWCKCDQCEKEFNVMDEGYVGPEDLGDVECHPFMKMTELCGCCYKKEKEKQDAESI